MTAAAKMVCKESFSAMIGPPDKRRQFLAEAGVTRVSASHPAVREHPQMWEPAEE